MYCIPFQEDVIAPGVPFFLRMTGVMFSLNATESCECVSSWEKREELGAFFPHSPFFVLSLERSHTVARAFFPGIPHANPFPPFCLSTQDAKNSFRHLADPFFTLP